MEVSWAGLGVHGAFQIYISFQGGLHPPVPCVPTASGMGSRTPDQDTAPIRGCPGCRRDMASYEELVGGGKKSFFVRASMKGEGTSKHECACTVQGHQ